MPLYIGWKIFTNYFQKAERFRFCLVSYRMRAPPYVPFGICCMGVPASVVGLILGCIAKKKGNRSGLRRAGVICSVVGILLTVVVIALGVVVALDYMETAHLTFTETENGLAVYVKAVEYSEHTVIGENAFTHSEKLQEIVIPEGGNRHWGLRLPRLPQADLDRAPRQPGEHRHRRLLHGFQPEDHPLPRHQGAMVSD